MNLTVHSWCCLQRHMSRHSCRSIALKLHLLLLPQVLLHELLLLHQLGADHLCPT